MWTKIEEYSASRFRSLAPRVRPEVRAVSFKVRFEQHRPAQALLFDQASHRAKISIPSPVLENRNHSLCAFREVYELDRFFIGGSERLINYDMLTCLKTF